MAATLTKTELEIMQYFWVNNKEVTAGDVREHFSQKNWSKQAVNTFLKKLVQRGFLNLRKVSISKYYYSYAITEDEYNLLPVKQIINDFYEGSLGNFVCALGKDAKISEEEADNLYKLVAQLKNRKE